jgi:hypothetical protein
MLTAGLCLTLMACAADSKAYRPGSDVRADLDKKSSAKFILKVGQRGYLMLAGRERAFELLRMNTMDNVTIELLDTGEQVELASQLAKEVRMEGYDAPVTFELSTMVQEMAVIYVLVPRKESAPPAVAAATSEKVVLRVKVLEDTTVSLALDGQPAQQIPLPKGTEVTWTAETRMQIDLAQAQRVELDINGAIHRPAEGTQRLQLTVSRQEGKLIIESH